MYSIRTCILFGKSCFFERNLVHGLISKVSPLLFHSTPVIFKEPMKKKKRVDPSILKHREDRKKKRIEKEIRRLSKIAQQLKPIDENEISLELRNSTEQRQRDKPDISNEEIFERYKLQKEWALYKQNLFEQDMDMINRVLKSRQRALEELRLESEDLYREAIQLDLSLLPFKCKGPTLTPPIKDYELLDGEFIDKTRKWDLE